MNLWILQYNITWFFFFSIYTTALVDLLGVANWSPESTYAYVYFSLLWLILWKYWDLVVVVKQSLCIGRSSHLWDYRQELCTTGRGRYWALWEGGRALEQVIKRDGGIFIPGNSQPRVQPAVAVPAQGLEWAISRAAHSVTARSACTSEAQWD